MTYGGPVMAPPPAGPPRYMSPCSEPSGRPGTLSVTVPSLDPAGQLIGFFVPIPISSGVHASSPLAAEVFRVMPGGSTTDAVLTCEESVSVAPRWCGRISSAVSPSVASGALLPCDSAKPGANGTLPSPHSLLPSFVMYGSRAVSPFSKASLSVWAAGGPAPVHEVVFVRNEPPALPLKTSRELIRGSSGDTGISK